MCPAHIPIGDRRETTGYAVADQSSNQSRVGLKLALQQRIGSKGRVSELTARHCLERCSRADNRRQARRERVEGIKAGKQVGRMCM
jgi:hypothetical protein